MGVFLAQEAPKGLYAHQKNTPYELVELKISQLSAEKIPPIGLEIQEIRDYFSEISPKSHDLGQKERFLDVHAS